MALNSPRLAEGTTLDALRGMANAPAPPAPTLTYGQRVGLAFLQGADPQSAQEVERVLRTELTTEYEADVQAQERRQRALESLNNAEQQVKDYGLRVTQAALYAEQVQQSRDRLALDVENEDFDRAQIIGAKAGRIGTVKASLEQSVPYLDLVTGLVEDARQDPEIMASPAMESQVRLLNAALVAHATNVQSLQAGLSQYDPNDPKSVLATPDAALGGYEESYQTVKDAHDTLIDMLDAREMENLRAEARAEAKAGEYADQLAQMTQKELDTVDAFKKTSFLSAEAEQVLNEANSAGALQFGQRQAGGLGQEFFENSALRQKLKEAYASINPPRITQDLGSQMTGPELALAEGIVLDHLAPYDQQVRQLESLNRLNDMVLSRIRLRFLMKGVTPEATAEYFGGMGMSVYTSPQFMGATPPEPTVSPADAAGLPE